jgi:hypothetical protein
VIVSPDGLWGRLEVEIWLGMVEGSVALSMGVSVVVMESVESVFWVRACSWVSVCVVRSVKKARSSS